MQFLLIFASSSLSGPANALHYLSKMSWEVNLGKCSMETLPGWGDKQHRG